MNKAEIYEAISSSFKTDTKNFRINASALKNTETFFYKDNAIFRIEKKAKGESVTLLNEKSVADIDFAALSDEISEKTHIAYYSLNKKECSFDLPLFLRYVESAIFHLIEADEKQRFGFCSLYKECAAANSCKRGFDRHYAGCLYKKSMEIGQNHYMQQSLYPKKSFKVLAFDTEFVNGNQCICQIGFYMEDISNGMPLLEKSILINPGKVHYDAFSCRIHGYTESMLQKEALFSKQYPEIRRILESADLVICHSKSADCHALYSELERYRLQAPNFKFADTLEMANSILGRITKKGLDDLKEFFGLPAFQHHDAFADAKTTLAIFKEFYKTAPNRSKAFVDSAASFAGYCREHGRLYSLSEIKGIRLDSSKNAKKLMKKLGCDKIRIAFKGAFTLPAKEYMALSRVKGWHEAAKETDFYEADLCVLGGFAIPEADARQLWKNRACYIDEETFGQLLLDPELTTADAPKNQSLQLVPGLGIRLMVDGHILASALQNVSDVPPFRFVSTEEALQIKEKQKNCSFVVTGEYQLGRSNIEKLITENGHAIKHTVSNQTNFLVVGQVLTGKAKIVDALEKEIPIISEETLLCLLGQSR